MRNILALCCLSAFFACKNTPDPVAQIARLEQNLAAQYNPAQADSLLTFYAQAIQAAPENHANNIRYLSRAAEIEYTRKQDGVAAVRKLNEAITQHGQGQSLTEPVGMLARIWSDYNYRAAQTTKLDPGEVDQMRLNLEKNLTWIDSCLIQLDHNMGGAAISDPATAAKFIKTAEGYAAVIMGNDPLHCSRLLMQAAGVAKTSNDPNKAIQLYYMVAEKLPPHAAQANALFMVGFIYNELGDLTKAKATYEDFLRRYPNNQLAESARMEIKNLGKTPEQILEAAGKK